MKEMKNSHFFLSTIAAKNNYKNTLFQKMSRKTFRNNSDPLVI